jgi:plasmid maintenance system killer protein
VIQSFKDENTAELFLQRRNRRRANIATVAIRKLDMLDSAAVLNDLSVPPGNRLEALTGTVRDNTASASTISTGSVLCGRKTVSWK